MQSRARRTLMALCALALVGAMAPGGPAMAAEETPDYAVLVEAENGVEIRRYPSMLLAEVTVSGTRDAAANEAFRILAGFIFGDNRSKEKVAMTAPVTQAPSEKIAMTAPVTQEPAESGDWVVAFMMPSEYTRETLPAPTDPRIRIRETEPHRAIAIRFSGRWTSANMEKHKRLIDAYIADQKLRTAGPAQFAYYNGPYTPFFLRRNEILYRLADDPAI